MVRFQKAVPADFQAIWNFYGQIIDGMADAECKPGWQRGVYPAESFIRESLANGELHTVWQDGALAGAMVLNRSCTPGYETVPWTVEAEPGEVSVIHALGVMPAFQGKGVAKALVREAVRLAKEAGQKALRLDVLHGNLPAQRLYASAGFQYRGTVQLFYEDTGLTNYLLYELAL